MSEATQLASAMLVIVFATVMWIAGQLYIESREIKSLKVSGRARCANRFYSRLTILPQVQTRSVTGSARQ
jgi:hypothetical protein